MSNPSQPEVSSDQVDALNLHLRESEERYRTLFDLVPVGVCTIDRAGVIQSFNSRAAELWGRTPVLGDTDERFCGSYKLFRLDGTFMPHAECPTADVINGTLSGVRDTKMIIERPDVPDHCRCGRPAAQESHRRADRCGHLLLRYHRP